MKFYVGYFDTRSLNAVKGSEKNVEYFLSEGPMTKYFVDKSFLQDVVERHCQAKGLKLNDLNKIKALMSYLRTKLEYSREEKWQNKKFNRTAEEIWEDKVVTGCTDNAIVFATFARQLNIPTTVLRSAEKGWVEKIQNGETANHSGHTFCECYLNDESKWILVDPTANRIMQGYTIPNIKLDYQLGGHTDYIAYFRDLDTLCRETTKEHNKKMDELFILDNSQISEKN